MLDVGARVAETYEVTGLIGRGGMGEVWAARHLRLPGKQVAIKVLHTRGAALTGEALARFRREAEVASRIGHPNIVEVHDYNTLPSGEPYLVLEFLNGESLASRLRFGPLPPDEALLLLRQVGSALDASHAVGVVHRDLKPDNIFLVPTPMGTQVKVLDFGISKIVDSSTVQTADEVLVGTPQYMSPEQATGHNSDVGPQTDVFALGSIAYEMLAGVPAFSADGVAKLVFRIAYEPHVPLEQVKPGLPERVYRAIDTALQKDRGRRWASIAAFIAELTGSPVPRTLPPSAPQAGGPGGVAAPGMATPDSLALGATAAPTPAPSRPPPARPSTVPAPVEVPASPPAPQRRLWMLVVAGVSLAVVSGALLLALGRPAAPGLDTPPPPESKTAKVLPVPVEPPPPATVAEPPDAVPEPARPPPPALAKKIAPDEHEVLAALEADLSTLKAPLTRTRQGLLQLHSDAGLSRGYALCAIAACKESNLMSAKPMFEKVTEKADRQRVLRECRALGVPLQ